MVSLEGFENMENNLDFEINFPSIMKFTMPSMIMMFIMSIYTIVDGVFVAALIGTDAFSAVNIIYPAMSLNIGIGTMFGTGITAIVSRKLGENREKEANEDFTFVMICAFLIGILFSAICLIFIKPIIYMLGANEEIYEYCYEYALPLFLFFGAQIPQIICQDIYVADGKPAMGLVVTIIGGVINAAFDYIFIAVFKLGIAGAAIATGLGCLVPAIFGIIYFALNRNGNVMFVKPKKKWKILLYSSLNGSSEMVNNFSVGITTLLFNVIMMHFAGQNGVAAISILLYLDFILIALNLGYSLGAAPLFSFNYGKKNDKKIKQLFSLSTKMSIIFGVIIMVSAIVFSPQLTSVFAKKGTEVYEMAVVGMKIYAISYIFKGFNVFSSAMFTAFENGKVSAILSFMRTLVLLSFAIVVMAYIWGVTGIWLSTPLAEGLALLMAVYYIVKNKDKYKYI